MHIITDFWNNLTQLKQRYFIAGSAAILLILIMLLLWAPVLKQHDRLNTRLNTLKKDIMWMRTTASVFDKSSEQNITDNKHRDLMNTIQTLNTKPEVRQLSLKNGEIEYLIKFNNITDFELFSWLDLVQKNTSAVVTKAIIKSSPKSDSITANFNILELHQR